MRSKIIFIKIIIFVITGIPITSTAVTHNSDRRISLYVPLYHNKIAVKVNVGQARLMVPESLIIVRGNIVQRISQDLYVFEDDSSSILVTIPDSVRGDARYDKRKLVELHGELSKSPTSVKIRVVKVVHIE